MKKKITTKDVPDRENDQLITHYIHRKISRRITPFLYNHTSLTGNQVTVIGFLFCMAGAALFTTGVWKLLIWGAVLLEFGYILDLCDGELARCRKESSYYGGYLDSALDLILDPLLIIAITIGAYRIYPVTHIWILGLASLYFFTVFYVTARFYTLNQIPHKPVKKKFSGFGKWYNLFFYARQWHINIIAVGALLNQLYLVLWGLAVVGNLYWFAYFIMQHTSVRSDFLKKK
jgi:phosphatidylglycerophosphate synthase